MAVILTDVQGTGGADVRAAPVPVDRLTLKVACALTGMARQTIYNRLSAEPEKFSPPMYRRIRGKRLERVITAQDLEVLRSMFPLVSRKT